MHPGWNPHVLGRPLPKGLGRAQMSRTIVSRRLVCATCHGV
jgi:hypothetical protein